MDRAYARLQADHVRSASTSPQRLPDSNPNAAGIRAFYFRDPDGHYLETLQFPPDKGDPKWHVANGALFLGIDHTAIVVHDTDASLAFYRDQLGFHVAGVSENYGIEQERHNNVPGAHLRITTMRAASGPGIEFLQYLQPSDGRAIPPDEQPDDLVYWQTTLVTSDLNAAGASLLQSGAFFVSNGIAVLRAQPDERAVVVRDPDGHALELLQRP
jgi:catechol 2,3-dioxygenase-like lactoylglutathione lyase family enzyme